MRKFVKFLTPSPALLIIRAAMKTFATMVAITTIMLLINLLFHLLPWEVSGAFWAGLFTALIWLAYCALLQNPYLNWRNQLFYGYLDLELIKMDNFYQLYGDISLEYIYRSHRIDFEVVIIQANGKKVCLPKKHMGGTKRLMQIPLKIAALRSRPIAIILRDKNYHREEKILLDGDVEREEES